MRLIIPTLSINVPVFFGKDGASRQDIIDAEESAVYFNWGQLTVIADHSSQANFHNLNKAKPGETIAYVCGDRVRKYMCDKTEVGHIRTEGGNRLYDSKWQLVHETVKNGICMYTCIKRSSKTVMDVILTHWVECNGSNPITSRQAEQIYQQRAQTSAKKVINKIRDLFRKAVVSA